MIYLPSKEVVSCSNCLSTSSPSAQTVTVNGDMASWKLAVAASFAYVRLRGCFDILLVAPYWTGWIEKNFFINLFQVSLFHEAMKIDRQG